MSPELDTMAIDPDLDATDPASAGAAPRLPSRDRHLLDVEGLNVVVGPQALRAVRDVAFSIRPGEAVGLVGESGSGKTLTCRAVLGALAAGSRLSGGTISLGGRSLVGLSVRDWEQLHGSVIAAVFQDPASYLNPSVPVGRQIAEVLVVKQRLSRTAARARGVELFAALGLTDAARVAKQLPAELSGGMLQRVAIAIAIACDPVLLIADEATTALDVTIQAEVLDLLANLQKERDLALLFVSHDLGVVAEVCDSIIVMYSGEIVESGPAEEILARPQHPYTQALVRVAAPGRGADHQFATIEGQPPKLGERIDGCHFASRCPFAEAQCTRHPIELRDVGDSHQARCRRIGELPDAVPEAGAGSL
jgi:peptide/nickel transport system ATP-binding protein